MVGNAKYKMQRIIATGFAHCLSQIIIVSSYLDFRHWQHLSGSVTNNGTFHSVSGTRTLPSFMYGPQNWQLLYITGTSTRALSSEGSPIKDFVRLSSDPDVLTGALEKEKVDLAPRLVSVQFDGEEVQSDAKAKDYVVKTSLGNPLLLMIDQEGEWPFTGTVCDGG